ncbi:MAG TPA: beta-phosphoglucomutase [Candidatus Choladousia intestinavium]|uniref:Beta-phosphoglucomutase n=1 Tax=Candidatus Choladousia intestinavium TaxID=2840727 RepID=A0A9D1ACQ4_9FIRM|nr:beta-phosphoglucomutase [Candidatus Choladousia intestinavium]
MIQGIIFDLDGVLVSTDKFHYQAWKRLADRLGIYFDEEINKKLRGVSRRESLEIILEGKKETVYTEKEKTEFTEEKNRFYQELLKQLTPSEVDVSVRKTLQELKKRGYKLAVGSSSKNAGTILNRTELIKEFDAVSDGNNIKRSKPDPEVFVKAAEMLNLSCEECAVVEDAEAGIEAAKRGGMMAVGIGPASESPKADKAVNKIEQLTEIFGMIHN